MLCLFQILLNAFSWIQVTVRLHCSRYQFDDEEVMEHDVNQWWPSLPTDIYTNCPRGFNLASCARNCSCLGNRCILEWTTIQSCKVKIQYQLHGTRLIIEVTANGNEKHNGTTTPFSFSWDHPSIGTVNHLASFELYCLPPCYDYKQWKLWRMLDATAMFV